VRRAALVVASVVGLSLLMLLVGAVAGNRGTTEPGGDGNMPTGGVELTRVAVGADVAQNIGTLQNRLKTVPQDWSAWATLGGLYTTQARLTADPSYYAKADGAFTESLKVQPEDNAAAVSGLATLAASRHDFAGALRLTQQAERLNAYSAPNLGVMVDAFTELGRYPEALTTLQRMVDLKPGVASFTRVSYLLRAARRHRRREGGAGPYPGGRAEPRGPGVRAAVPGGACLQRGRPRHR
jgi:hypothetical protein